jgi:hypothetical protein
MSIAAYVVPLYDQIQTHDNWLSTLRLHDLPRDTEKLHTQALVASGDYFETLAAALEQIAVALPPDSVEQYQLQHYVGQLLYLQRSYQITKKQ